VEKALISAHDAIWVNLPHMSASGEADYMGLAGAETEGAILGDDRDGVDIRRAQLNQIERSAAHDCKLP
jgi:hypothetical protein